MKTKIYFIWFIVVITALTNNIVAQEDSLRVSYEDVYKKIDLLFDDADIPGLSFILVDENNTYIENWGYADKDNKIPVTSNTLFELGSVSKAFTALAIHKLEEDGLICLDDYVSKYIPWFKVFYNDEKVNLTIKQLLHHTSGIPMETISKIPQGDGGDMLEKTVRDFNNMNLESLPGARFEYASINYDILGLIVSEVSNLSFEDYLQKNIFGPLQLNNTTVGNLSGRILSKGYKIGFFTPNEYEAPRYRGNNPAAYIISNAKDMSQWLRYQLKIDTNVFQKIIAKSHIPDLTVAPNAWLSSYGSGWFVETYGSPKVYHAGLNPNFSSYIGFLPDKNVGIAILSNSNSNYTEYMGNIILKSLNGEDISEIPKPENSIDKVFSLISYFLVVFLLGVLVLLVWLFKGLFTGERKLNPIGFRSIVKILLGAVLTIPFIYAIYLLPKVILEFSWDSIVIWAPNSYLIGCILFGCSIIGVWFLSTLSVLVPTKNKYYRSMPMLIILSIMSGLANMVIILILINAVGSETKVAYILYYFVLVLVFYISSRKIVQTKLIKISLSIIYELRMKLINKIFLSSFQKFEKIDNGRVYATLNQDTATISNSVNIIISIISNAITIIGVFIYLGTISFIATILILLVIFGVALLYFLVTNSTNILFEKARDTANEFAGLIDGLLYGFKELSLSGLKKKEYTDEIEASCSELKSKTGTALIKFVNAFLIGETLLIVVLGTVSFVIPFMFPEIPNYKLLGFIMIVLYLIGPINGVLGAIPNIIQIKISWKRIKSFIDDINPDLKLTDLMNNRKKELNISNLSARELMFEYDNKDEDNSFKVGPVSLDINSGEILFIIGGNGSGKSTLANLLTGLYVANSGCIEINGKEMNTDELGELYSTIFSNHHIFKKLYGINTEDKKDEMTFLLNLLQLESKVKVEKGKFSTIELSNGQRKRLSLMKSFLEDSQIYLFDEWAADQDPEYKRIFYRELLPKMKEKGKIVIAITHDDNYFDVADKIIKLNSGKVVEYKSVEAFKKETVRI